MNDGKRGMNPRQTAGFDWKSLFIGLGVVFLILCPPLWLPAWIVVVIFDFDRPSPDLRINDPVWDHRDHLPQPRVGQGQGSGLI